MLTKARLAAKHQAADTLYHQAASWRRYLVALKARCPHCGNTAADLIESNLAPGERGEETLLCLSPCAPGEGTFDYLPADDPAATTCGCQWNPRDPEL